ncbi:Uncharacterised protein at_DN1718, partial [Pycnogonum litorale]
MSSSLLSVILLTSILKMITTSCPPPEDLIMCNCREVRNILDVECYSISKESELANELSYFVHVDDYRVNLTLKSSTIASISSKMFSDVSLYEFTTEEVLLTHINEGAFQGSEESLQIINIVGHLMNSIPVGALRVLKNLRRLDLSSGGIFGSLRTDTFDNMLQGLNYLCMILCGISYIESGAFKSLRSLEILDLSENPLTAIESSVLPADNRLRLLRL